MPFLLSSQNVINYLIDQGICQREDGENSSIEIKPAKNFNLLLTLADGRQLLVKQEPHNDKGETAGEFLQEWQFQKLLQTCPGLMSIRAYFSQAIYFDAVNSIIVFDYLKPYRDLAEFYSRENIFPSFVAAKIGTIIAAIHRLTLDRQDYQGLFASATKVSSSRALEMITDLQRLTPDIFGSYPDQGLRFFGLYQRYSSLNQAITDLADAIAPCCLIHNDLKLNNILLAHTWQEAVSSTSLPTNSIIRLIDWEMSTWGDPASDLGTIIASYLQIWLYGLITNKTIPIQESLQLATTPLEQLQPSIATLMSSYLRNFPEILNRRPDFLRQTVQFSGLALIQAILSTLYHEKTFGNSEICILQVAKTLLCRPEQSIETIFGLTEFELINYAPLHLQQLAS
jgi:hypothetical protein